MFERITEPLLRLAERESTRAAIERKAWAYVDRHSDMGVELWLADYLASAGRVTAAKAKLRRVM